MDMIIIACVYHYIIIMSSCSIWIGPGVEMDHMIIITCVYHYIIMMSSCSIWMGVELDHSHGKNDGSRAGVRYFRCRPNHGVFVLPSKVKRSVVMMNSVPL